MNQVFVDWWGPLAQFEADNEETMLASGYFAKEAKPGLIVVSFNNIYWLVLFNIDIYQVAIIGSILFT